MIGALRSEWPFIIIIINDQESVSKFLWDIRNIRANSGSECLFLS